MISSIQPGNAGQRRIESLLTKIQLLGKNYRKVVQFNHDHNTRYSFVVIHNSSPDFTMFNLNWGGRFFIMDGMQINANQHGSLFWKKNADNSFNNYISSYPTESKSFMTSIGRSCYRSTSPTLSYCSFVQIHNEFPNALVETDEWRSYAYAVTSTHEFVDSGQANQHDCDRGFAKNQAPVEGLVQLNGNEQKSGKAIMIIKGTNGQSECYGDGFQVESMVRIAKEKASETTLSTGTPSFQYGIHCEQATYSITQSADYFQKIQAVPVWKNELVKWSFKNQYTVTPSSQSDASQKCPIVMTYAATSSPSSLVLPDYPQLAFYDTSQSQFILVFPQKTKSSTEYATDLYLVMMLNFDFMAKNFAYNYGTKIVRPVWADYYHYPSCKPGCIQANGNIMDYGFFRMESDGKALRNHCTNVQEDQLINYSANSFCLAAVSKWNVQYCASDDAFELKDPTAEFKWDYDVSEFPTQFTTVLDFIKFGPTQNVNFNRIKAKDDSGSYQTIAGDLALMLSIPDNNVGTVDFQAGPKTEFYKKGMELFVKNSYNCYFNDKRQWIPKYAYIKGEMTIDNCVGQEIKKVKTDEVVALKIQKAKGKVSIVTSESELFTVLDATRCPIRKYEAVDDAGLAFTSSSDLYSLLYVSELLADTSKLQVSLNTDQSLGGQIAKVFTFQFKATAHRIPAITQKYKVILGCFEQQKVSVEFKQNSVYDFVQQDGENLFKVVSKPKQFTSASEIGVLSIDLSKVLTWSTDVANCYQSKVSICNDFVCSSNEVVGVKFESVERNEETGVIGDTIIKISTLVPKLQYFFIRSEIPNGNQLTSKIKLNVCGQETVRGKFGSYRKIRKTEQKKWLQIPRWNWIEFSQEPESECPIEEVRLCQDQSCQITTYDQKQFSIKGGILGINLEIVQKSKFFWLQAISKGGVQGKQKFQLTVLKQKPKPNMAPRFQNGLGDVSLITAVIGQTAKLEFTSKKATDLEKNEISIEITSKKPKFAEFEIKGDSFVVKIDQEKILQRDLGKKTIEVVLSDDVSKSVNKYSFTIEVKEADGEGEAEGGDPEKEGEQIQKADAESEATGSIDKAGEATGSIQKPVGAEASGSSTEKGQEENVASQAAADCDPEDKDCLEKAQEAELLQGGLDDLLAGSEDLGDLGDLGDLSGLSQVASASLTGSGSSPTVSGSSGVAAKKINPIDQARLNYILSILKKRAAEKESGAIAKEEEVEPPKILAAWIEKTSQLGEVMVKFNQTLVEATLPKVEDFNTNLLRMTIEPVVKDDEYNATKYEFTWQIKKIDLAQSMLTFQLEFYEPLQISTGKEPDKIFISFRQPWMFQGQQSKLFLDSQFNKISASMNKQMINNEAAANLQGSTQAAAQAMENATIVMFILQLVLKGVLKKLMGALVLIQVIIHMGVLSVDFPGNILLFNSEMRPIISFDIMKYLGELNKVIFSFDFAAQKKMREEKMITSVKEMGLQFTNCIINLGMFGQVIVLFLFLSLVVAPVMAILSKITKSQRINNAYIKLKNKVFFSLIIGILTKGYMPILIALYVNYQCAIWTTSGEIVANYYATVCFFLALVGLPMAIVVMIALPEYMLEEPRIKQRLGSLYGNIKVENRMQRASSLMFVARRFLLIFLGLVMFETPGIQAQVIMMLNVMVVIYQAQVRPFKTVDANRTELVNESFMIMISYNVFFYTDWIPDKLMQYELAWNHIYIISAMVLYNSFAVVVSIKNNVRLYILKYFKIIDRKLTQKTYELADDKFCPSTEQLRFNKDNYRGKYRPSGYRLPDLVLRDPQIPKKSFVRNSRLPDKDKLFQKINLTPRKSAKLSPVVKQILQPKFKPQLQKRHQTLPLAVIDEEAEGLEIKTERALKDLNQNLDEFLQNGEAGDIDKLMENLEEMEKQLQQQ